MSAATGGQLVTQPAQHFRGLGQKVGPTVDEETALMVPPRLLDAAVDLGGPLIASRSQIPPAATP